MENFKFYHVDEGYIEYLHKLDWRVQYNKGEKRPYVGIVLEIGEISYFVPLESPKENHKNIGGGGPVLKLDDGALGIMGFNNMIPIAKPMLIPFDFEQIKDEKYKALLQKQFIYCRKNRDIILSRAKSTYRKASDCRNTFYRKTCCDFKRLESSYLMYKRKNWKKR